MPFIASAGNTFQRVLPIGREFIHGPLHQSKPLTPVACRRENSEVSNRARVGTNLENFRILENTVFRQPASPPSRCILKGRRLDGAARFPLEPEGRPRRRGAALSGGQRNERRTGRAAGRMDGRPTNSRRRPSIRVPISAGRAAGRCTAVSPSPRQPLPGCSPPLRSTNRCCSVPAPPHSSSGLRRGSGR